MNIQTPGFNQRTISFYPWMMLLVGTIFMAVAIFFMVASQLSYSIDCQNKTPSMAQGCLVKTKFYQVTLQTKYIGDLQRATAYSWRTKKGKRQYGVKVIGSAESARLGFMSMFSQSDTVALAQNINEYIQSSTTHRFYMKNIANHWLFLFGSVFFIVGCSIAISSRKITIHIDKNTKHLTIKRKNIFNTEVKELSTDNINTLILQTTRNTKGQTIYRVCFQMSDGQTIPLQKSYDNYVSQKLKLIAELTEFLELDESESVRAYKANLMHTKITAKIAFIIGGLITIAAILFMILR